MRLKFLGFIRILLLLYLHVVFNLWFLLSCITFTQFFVVAVIHSLLSSVSECVVRVLILRVDIYFCPSLSRFFSHSHFSWSFSVCMCSSFIQFYLLRIRWKNTKNLLLLTFRSYASNCVHFVVALWWLLFGRHAFDPYHTTLHVRTNLTITWQRPLFFFFFSCHCSPLQSRLRSTSHLRIFGIA